MANPAISVDSPAAIVEAFNLGFETGKRRERDKVPTLLRNLEIRWQAAREDKDATEVLAFILSDIERTIQSTQKQIDEDKAALDGEMAKAA